MSSNFATPATALSRPVPQRIYLAGMPGSGKSAVGRQLADRLGYRFLDLDEELERLAGRSTIELLRNGEEAFRAFERRALEGTTSESRIVVATGGGALVDMDALDAAMRAGVVIYLRVPVATLARRLVGRVDRPLLLDERGGALPRAALRRRITATLRERESSYSRSDFVFDAGRRSPGALAEMIASRLGA